MLLPALSLVGMLGGAAVATAPPRSAAGGGTGDRRTVPRRVRYRRPGAAVASAPVYPAPWSPEVTEDDDTLMTAVLAFMAEEGE